MDERTPWELLNELWESLPDEHKEQRVTAELRTGIETVLGLSG